MLDPSAFSLAMNLCGFPELQPVASLSIAQLMYRRTAIRRK
jgi:hypothetical protein